MIQVINLSLTKENHLKNIFSCFVFSWEKYLMCSCVLRKTSLLCNSHHCAQCMYKPYVVFQAAERTALSLEQLTSENKTLETQVSRKTQQGLWVHIYPQRENTTVWFWRGLKKKNKCQNSSLALWRDLHMHIHKCSICILQGFCCVLTSGILHRLHVTVQVPVISLNQPRMR